MSSKEIVFTMLARGIVRGCLEGKVDWRDELTEKKGREEKTDNEKKEVC